MAQLAAYLDNLYILITVSTIATTRASLAAVFNPSYSTLVLHPGKSELWTPDIYRYNHGAEVLGTAIGSLPFRERFLATKLSHWVDHVALLRPLSLQERQLLFRFCVVPTLGHLPRTLRSHEPPLMAIWERADSYVLAEMQCYAASPAPSLVELKRLVALPMCYGGFGIQQYQTTVSITYTSAKAASLLHLSHLGLLPPSDSPPPDLRAALRTMYTEQAAALRADLPIAYHSTYDDHCNKSSYAFLTVCPTTKATTLTDTEFQLGCLVRCFNAGRTGRCSCNASRAVPGHDLVCIRAGAERTLRHEGVKGLFQDSFQRSCSYSTLSLLLIN